MILIGRFIMINNRQHGRKRAPQATRDLRRSPRRTASGADWCQLSDFGHVARRACGGGHHQQDLQRPHPLNQCHLSFCAVTHAIMPIHVHTDGTNPAASNALKKKRGNQRSAFCAMPALLLLLLVCCAVVAQAALHSVFTDQRWVLWLRKWVFGLRWCKLSFSGFLFYFYF